MNGDAVIEVTKLAQMSAEDSTVVIDDQTYSARHLERVAFDPVVKDELVVHSLSAFAELINRDFDKAYDVAELVAIIEDEKTVQLVSRPVTEDLKRARPLKCELMPLEGFRFGQWYDLEQFTIDLSSLFEDTPDRAAILSYVQKVDVTEQIQFADDGITQSASVRKGASGAVTEHQEAKSFARLQPFRTFREVEQPESTFLFRMKLVGQARVQCALFEADGGAWRLSAVDSIYAFLTNAISTDLLIVS